MLKCFRSDLYKFLIHSIKKVGRVVTAFVVAVFLLSLVVIFYYIRPVHIENIQGNTDYVWPPKSYWVTLTEGISFGQFDAQGFNNPAVIDNPDILVLGSSHMEGTNIFPWETAPYLLGKKLNGMFSIYNKGISGHNFLKICQYLPVNIELYKQPPKFVIMESSVEDVTQKDVDDILSNKIKQTQSHNTGIIGTLQRIPFFRLIYMQKSKGLLKLFAPISNNDDHIDAHHDGVVDENPYRKLFAFLRSVEDKYGTEIIIAYHPTGKIQKDGSILFKPSEKKDLLKKVADENEITFVDLTADFEKMYYQDQHVAHGFATGKLESGHLNKYGHAAMAGALYKTIVEMKKGGILCK